MSIFELERDGDMEALSAALTEADSASVRHQAARALGDLDPPEAGGTGAYETMLQSLRTAVIDDDHQQVRTSAVTALEQHGIKQLKRLVRELTDQPLEAIGPQTYSRLVSSPRPELRMVGLAALGLEGTAANADVIVAAYDDDDPRVRERAIDATAKLGLSRAEPRLVAALDDPAPSVRAAAAGAIGELTLRSAAAALARATDDEHEPVRLAAIDALASLGSPAAIEPLAAALGSSNPAENRLAVYGLLELMANAPASASHEIRERVQRIAEGVAGTTVIDTIIDLLDAMDGTTQRRNAVWLLGRLVDDVPQPQAIDTLVSHVGDDDDHTAKLATSALVRCEGSGIERVVRERLETANPDAAEAGQLAYVLGRVGSDRSIETLEATLERTQTKTVRQQVVGALNRLETTGRATR